jgi:hypothetical protein
MEPIEAAILIIKGGVLFLIITYAVKIGVKEALIELKHEEKKQEE